MQITRPTARRDFLRACLSIPATLLLAACGRIASGPSSPATATSGPGALSPTTNAPPPAGTRAAATASPVAPTAIAQSLPPTPACGDDDDEPTLAQTEGPYFTPNSPERASLLESGITGTTLVVTGYILSTDCRPVARALLDVWHANDAGEYDNVGYKLRGHQFTDDAGRYSLETIVPGLYPGRTRHIHVKVQAPGGPILTTQLYFPGEARNNSDGIFNAALLMDVQDGAAGKAATFNFVVQSQ